MTLELVYERCARTRSVASSCQACVEACPTHAVSLGGPRRSVEVALDDCVRCGLCQAACPTEAFRGAIDVAALVAARPTEVACGQGGVPCVGAFSEDELLSLALATGRLVVRARSCLAGPSGHERARRAVERARALAGALGLEASFSWQDESRPVKAPTRPVAARRQLLGLLVPRAAPKKLSSPSRLDVAGIRAVGLTPRRERLLGALSPSQRSTDESSSPAEAVACVAGHRLDAAACTGCMLCVSACPTGALSTPRLHRELRFEARRCVACALCHDVCETKAITPASEVRVADFVAPSPRVLVALDIVQCGECGAPFRRGGGSEGEDGRCPSCRAREDEARSLWGQS